MGVGGVNRVPATGASTLSDKPRWEKDIEPLVETAAWNPGKDCRAQPRNGTQLLLGIFGYADRRLIQGIAFRYRAASSRNIVANWQKSMEQAREALKKLNVLHVFPGIAPLAFHLLDHNCRPRELRVDVADRGFA